MPAIDPEILVRIRERAAEYDAENRFFTEDLEELRAHGYLHSDSLLNLVRSQRELASHAPATALGLSMHHVIVGMARGLANRGDHSLEWIIDDAARGELFAFGNSEAGNDAVMFDSATVAQRVEAGWTFTGTKIFTSLSPAWTRLGVFGKDASDPDNPQLVHGFLLRETAGHSRIGEWQPLGMRATQSFTTKLDEALVFDRHISRRLPVGPTADPYIHALFANFLLLIASVSAGIADRALELGVHAAHARTSRARDGAALQSDPNVRWTLAHAAIELDSLKPQIEQLASDFDAQRDRDDWSRQLAGVKTRAVEIARSTVDAALRVSGGASYLGDSELSRLYRDSLAGLFQPSDPESAHASVANALLGPIPTS
ncbi:acyl-CoA dehydrogenase family protein [Humidisolicoccus flavus]|uniref:acyl-CoA dehydrogenase family protein n=1 Tax=Humidisolicoccus flavus TaxID=3111414 RepID=UPI003249BF4D